MILLMIVYVICIILCAFIMGGCVSVIRTAEDRGTVRRFVSLLISTVILLIAVSAALFIQDSKEERDREIITEEISTERRDCRFVTTTVYHAVASQCNEDFLTTASGKKIKKTHRAYEHRYIALSRDLIGTFVDYGDRVIIEGCPVERYNGEWEVADTMNKRYSNCADLLINPGMPTGKWECVKIIKK